MTEPKREPFAFIERIAKNNWGQSYARVGEESGVV
jgi:hypothetical protein